LQNNLVKLYQERVVATRDANTIERINMKFEELDDVIRLVCPILKVRICDAKAFGKSMILTIWYPTQEVISMMREGNIVRMSSVSAEASLFNEIIISAGKKSRFEVINTQLDRFPLNLAAMRQLTPIEVVSDVNFDPIYNEFDVVGIVVKVREFSDCTLVYLADLKLNLLGIIFQTGIKNFAYDDVVTVKTVLCASNLHWIPSVNNKGIPKAHTSKQTTMFNIKPAQQEMHSAVSRMQTALDAMNIDDFVEKCVEKIRELECTPPVKHVNERLK
jgi:hypothetical protein